MKSYELLILSLVFLIPYNVHAQTSPSSPQFIQCDANIRARCASYGDPSHPVPFLIPILAGQTVDDFYQNYPNAPSSAAIGSTVSFIYNCLYTNPRYPGEYNYYSGFIGTCSYVVGPTSNLDLSVIQSPGMAFTASPSSPTLDGKFSVKPNIPTTIYVNVSGSEFNTPESRSATVSLKIGNNSPMTTSVSVASIQAAGTLQVPFTYTFTANEAGKVDLSASISSSEDSNVGNNTVSDNTYVLCNVEDSGIPLVYFPQGGAASWANDDYANQAPQKMRKLGCYTSSFAMLMKSYKIAKSADGFSSINPGSVNAGLNLIGYYSELGPAYSTYGGYTPSGAVHPIGAVNFARASYAKNCIAAGGIPSACKAKAAGKISYIGRTNTFSTYDQDALNKQLCAGNPVILKVKSISRPSDPTKAHFVLGKGMTVAVDGSLQYLSYDPARTNGPDDSNFNYPISEIKGFRLYKQISDPSMISIHLSGGLNMIITDPMGNRVGYDPYTGQSYNSISGATYSSPESIDSPDGDNISTPLETTFENVVAIDGRYQVQIFGNPSGAANYRLTRYSFDEVGNINAISDKSGKILAGQSVVLTADHTSAKIPVRYANLNINKALFFDSVRKDKAFVAGRIIPEDGRAISRIDRFVTIRVGSFVRSIELKKMQKIKIRKDTYYIYLDWGRKGLAFEINADTGEFALSVDNIDLDDTKPSLTTNIDVQIDDLQAENVATFKDVKRRKGGK